MARPALITRTLKYTSIACTCVILDENGAHSENRVFTLSKVHDAGAKTLARLRKMYETENVKIAAIVSTTIIEERRKMTEETFIANSEVMDVNEEAETAE